MIQSMLILTVVFILAACAAKTNAEKCTDMGGTYNARTQSCQFQSELPKR
jgi:hypothetical protein